MFTVDSVAPLGPNAPDTRRAGPQSKERNTVADAFGPNPKGSPALAPIAALRLLALGAKAGERGCWIYCEHALRLTSPVSRFFRREVSAAIQ